MAGPASAPATAAAATYERYTAVAIALHWLIAAAIVAQIALGMYASDAIRADDAQVRAWAFEQIQIHKATGLTILALTVLRIVWRLTHPAPPLPPGTKRYERAGSAISHYGFYFLMLALPLSGWAMSSVSVEFSALPTLWYGLFQIPHLPLAVTGEAQAALDAGLHATHDILGKLAIALLVLHVGAALKHHLVDRDAVLARMVPGLSPRGGPGAGAGGGAIVGRRGISGARAALAALIAAGAGFGGGVLAVYNVPSGGGGGAVLGAAGPMRAEAPLWAVDPEASAIRFSGAQSGSPLAGEFGQWSAEIAFDPDNPAAGRARVEIDMASASTGNMMFDGTFPDPDWFDSAAHPLGLFEADRFVETETDYAAEGTLTLKDRARPVTLPFALTIEGGTAEVAGTLTLDRFEWGIGASTGAASVDAEVIVEIDLVATRE